MLRYTVPARLGGKYNLVRLDDTPHHNEAVLWPWMERAPEAELGEERSWATEVTARGQRTLAELSLAELTDGTYAWDIVGPEGICLVEGTASTEQEAKAKAMLVLQAWLCGGTLPAEEE